MTHFIKSLLLGALALTSPLLLAAETSATKEAGPAPYLFSKARVDDAWVANLPKDAQRISKTCYISPAENTVYALCEFTGLEANYETEYLLIGKLSDRAYESLAISLDHGSTLAKAFAALHVPQGNAADTMRGTPVARGERFTISLCPLNAENKPVNAQTPFASVADYVTDERSPASNNLFARGMPYIGKTGTDDLMPAAIVALYNEPDALFGLPYDAPKSAVYGLYRAKKTFEMGERVILAFRWQKLDQPRVYNAQLTIGENDLKAPDEVLAKLKALCEDPRDIFLDVTLTPNVKLAQVVPLASLILDLESQGGFTLLPSSRTGFSIRAFKPNPAWNDRAKRVFQPWEVELRTTPDGQTPTATLCQILEDWTVEGNDPKLTRKCYPDLTPDSILPVLKRIDVRDGKIYVVFFYATPETTMADLEPFAKVLSDACPTQWLFFLDKTTHSNVD